MSSTFSSAHRRVPPRPHAIDPDVLLAPDHGHWEQARQAWNLAVDQRPAAIGMPRSAFDIPQLVDYARARGLRIAPQATGHHAACLGSLENCLLLKTERMRDVRIDPTKRTARVECGVLWSEVTDAAAQHGLAALAGSARDVGVTGYTLGGGLSWFARRHGLASNHVVRAEVVTADGRRLRVDADHDYDLFWALRGGGGSYAIVTALEFELLPITEVYAGALMWPLEQAGEVLTEWLEWLTDVPDEITSIGRLVRVPPLPDIPPELRGQELVVVEAVHLGDAADGEELLRPLSRLSPTIGTFATLPPETLGFLHMDPPNPVPAFGDGMILSELTAEGLDALLEVAGPEQTDSRLLALDLRHLGGALASPQPGGGAVSSIDGEFAVFAVGMTPTPEAKRPLEEQVDAIQRALSPWGHSRAYFNLAERPRSAEDLFGEDTHARLREVKAAYDPDDVIYANHPVRP